MSRGKKALQTMAGLFGVLFFAAILYSVHHVYKWATSLQDADDEVYVEETLSDTSERDLKEVGDRELAGGELSSTAADSVKKVLPTLQEILENDDICTLVDNWSELVSVGAAAQAMGEAPTKFVKDGLSIDGQFEIFQKDSPLNNFRVESPRSREALFFNLLNSTGLSSGSVELAGAEPGDDGYTAQEDLRKYLAAEPNNPLAFLISAHLKKEFGETKEEVKAELLKALDLRGHFIDYRRETIKNLYERGRVNTSYFYLARFLEQHAVKVNYRKLMDSVVIPYATEDDRRFAGDVLSMSWREVARNTPKRNASFSIFKHSFSEFEFYQSIYNMIDKTLWPRSAQDTNGINDWWAKKRTKILEQRAEHFNGIRNKAHYLAVEEETTECNRDHHDQVASRAMRELFGGRL